MIESSRASQILVDKGESGEYGRFREKLRRGERTKLRLCHLKKQTCVNTRDRPVYKFSFATSADVSAGRFTTNGGQSLDCGGFKKERLTGQLLKAQSLHKPN
jgi:hypothetical protein